MRLENYAAGLVEELAGYERAGMKDRAKDVRAELDRISPDLPRALAVAETDFVSGIKLYDVKDPEQVRAVFEAQPEVQRLRRLENDLTDLGYYGASRKRTTRAPGAPETVVPPAPVA
ncbi:hypothetical protein [Kutzneria buriramensis]|uniref:Uncharacterized protein n=1 Tax=Kutzneria buriramensis TaxID=1045776 RepID=A0A3E0HEK3_9PSEU|nr:hypothetical protein [Kutzneria buriramensis]REH43640.1 hypothetical protein BCF44_109183 [Kutzneria buriramensis]